MTGFTPFFCPPFLTPFLGDFSPFSCFSSKNLEENTPFSVEGGKILAKNRQKSQFFALFSSRFFEEKTLGKMVENLSSRFFEEKSPILRFLHKMLSSYSARKWKTVKNRRFFLRRISRKTAPKSRMSDFPGFCNFPIFRQKLPREEVRGKRALFSGFFRVPRGGPKMALFLAIFRPPFGGQKMTLFLIIFTPPFRGCKFGLKLSKIEPATSFLRNLE